MLDIKYIRNNFNLLKSVFKNRNVEVDLDTFQKLDEKRRKLILSLESLQSKRNEISLEIGKLKGKGEDASSLMSDASSMNVDIKKLEKELSEIEPEIYKIMISMPNSYDDDVPIGKSDEHNMEIKKIGNIPKFDFRPLSHDQILKNMNIVDSERAVKVSGSRFVVLRGEGALLERSLIDFMIGIHVKNGYTEMAPPFLVKESAMVNSGQLPKFADDAYSTDGMYLIPTAEVPLSSLHGNEVFNEEDLPINYTAYTPCFRKEAGSYGKDTKGLIRLHQFNKVELVKLVKEKDSAKELKNILKDAENILKAFKLPYRVILKCSGDTSFQASKTYDIEVWMPSQKRYVEISSCSNTKDFQSRRASIKVKNSKSKKNDYVHILNGSGLAVGRTMAAIVENYQLEDGTFDIEAIFSKIKEYKNGR